jgi:hypothetical protein
MRIRIQPTKINADPDPQHCYFEEFGKLKMKHSRGRHVPDEDEGVVDGVEDVSLVLGVQKHDLGPTRLCHHHLQPCVQQQ